MAGNSTAEQRNFNNSTSELFRYDALYRRDLLQPHSMTSGELIDAELNRRGTYRLKTGEYGLVLDYLAANYSAREIAQFLIEKRNK